MRRDLAWSVFFVTFSALASLIGAAHAAAADAATLTRSACLTALALQVAEAIARH